MTYYIVRVSQNIEHSFLVEATSKDEAMDNWGKQGQPTFSDDAGMDVAWDAEVMSDSDAQDWITKYKHEQETANER
jgi:hypothetical protein